MQFTNFFEKNQVENTLKKLLKHIKLDSAILFSCSKTYKKELLISPYPEDIKFVFKDIEQIIKNSSEIFDIEEKFHLVCKSTNYHQNKGIYSICLNLGDIHQKKYYLILCNKQAIQLNETEEFILQSNSKLLSYEIKNSYFQPTNIEDENRFSKIVEKSHASIIIIDENRKLIYANPKSQKLFGYSKEELEGIDFLRLLSNDSIELVKTRYEERQKGESVPEYYEFKTKNKNGGENFVEICSTTYKNDNGEVRTIAQLLDITEHKMALYRELNEKQIAQKYLDIAAFMAISIRKDGRLKMINRKACEILGYAEDELIGENWFTKCLPSNNTKRSQNKFSNLFLKTTKNHHSESVIETKDGKERIIHWISSTINDENGNPVELLSSGEDITDKINSHKILNQANVVAVMRKFTKDPNNYPVIYISNNIKLLTGYTQQDFTSKSISFFELIHPDDKFRVSQEIKTHTQSQNSKKYTHEFYRIKTKNGSWIWIQDQTEIIRDDLGNISHLSGILQDVTEKQNTLKLIKEKEERYRTIFFSNLDGLVIFDSKAKIVEVNDVLCETYGYTREELINRNNSQKVNIGSNLDLPFVKQYLRNNVTLNSESVDFKKDGTKFHASSKLRWITYNNEDHILAIIRDISDKKENEFQLIKAKEKAEESDQLKSSFLANMSHEIRTPMNSIIGFTSLIGEDELDEDERNLFIRKIKTNSQQLLRLINDIIDISKIEANQVNIILSSINLPSFLADIYEIFNMEAQSKSIHLSYDCINVEEITNFKSDPNRLTQIISNLINNALKFTSENGSISFGCYPSKSELIFYIKDNGIGIAKEAQTHIFDRFRQAHKMTYKDFGGTGLGLSIVKGLIDSMNGRIWVDSQLGKGASFYFSLPL